MNTRILLVDANDEARSSLVRRLESDSRVSVVAHVSSVDEAGEAIRGLTCDLSIINVRSHDSASLGRCKELRELVDRPLLVLASFMTTHHWQGLQRAGADDYMLKDANSRSLCNAVVRLAERFRTESGSLDDIPR